MILSICSTSSLPAHSLQSARCHRRRFYGRRSLFDNKISAIASVRGLASRLPLPCTQTLTALASMSRFPITNMVCTFILKISKKRNRLTTLAGRGNIVRQTCHGVNDEPFLLKAATTHGKPPMTSVASRARSLYRARRQARSRKAGLRASRRRYYTATRG